MQMTQHQERWHIQQVIRAAATLALNGIHSGKEKDWRSHNKPCNNLLRDATSNCHKQHNV
jgi:alcohol dehydrogenase YqhD (iron-dependent ADH family)